MPANQTDLLFPPHLFLSLGELRGPAWQDLVCSISKLSESSLEQAAIVLLIARLANCSSCNGNSQRAALGCADCSKQALKRFHGSDQELVQAYETAKLDVNAYLRGIPDHPQARQTSSPVMG